MINFKATLSKLEKSVTVVRLSRSFWNDENGVYQRTSLRVLKRKSSTKYGYVLVEDALQSSAEEVLPRVVNLHECEDGVYEVVCCNVSKDWETRYDEDWDFKLIPYESK